MMYSIGYKDKDGFVRLIHRSDRIPLFRLENIAELEKELIIKEIDSRLDSIIIECTWFGLRKKVKNRKLSERNRHELKRIRDSIHVIVGNISHMVINPVNLDELLK